MNKFTSFHQTVFLQIEKGMMIMSLSEIKPEQEYKYSTLVTYIYEQKNLAAKVNKESALLSALLQNDDKNGIKHVIGLLGHNKKIENGLKELIRSELELQRELDVKAGEISESD